MKQIIVIKRLMAFMIDMLIVSLIVSLILVNNDTSINDKRSRELMKVINDYSSEKITTDEYLDKYSNILYDINNDNFDENVVYLIVSIGYFLIFQYLNRGATIGKRFMNLRIVNKDKTMISFWQLLIRVSLVNRLLSTILLLVFTKTLVGFNFFMGYGIVSLGENLFVIVCGLSFIFSKNNVAIHDKLSNSQVIIDEL